MHAGGKIYYTQVMKYTTDNTVSALSSSSSFMTYIKTSFNMSPSNLFSLSIIEGNYTVTKAYLNCRAISRSKQFDPSALKAIPIFSVSH
jgi:hypothetical protein